MSGLDMLEDLEKNPAARKYDVSSYNLDEYMLWLDTMIPDYDWMRPAIHVAGTKGKGSVSAMVEALLLEAQLSTGLYTSPHANHFGERLRFSGKALSETEFNDRVEHFLIPWKNSGTPFRPTVFEALTGFAFREFREADVDAEIYEVGLGGRLDCTNLILPDVSVITPIGMDHTALLGDMIEKIAHEKAGIIKNSVPVVIPFDDSPEQKTAIKVMCHEAKQKDAPWYHPWPIIDSEATAEGHRVVLNMNDESVECQLNLHGEFQARNWSQAVRAAGLFMARRGKELTNGVIQNAAGKINWSGRLQHLVSLPAVLVDSAHCSLSARSLGASLAGMKEIASPPYVLLWGMQKDKDHLGFLEALIETAGKDAISRIVCYSMDEPRGAQSSELFTAARKALVKCLAMDTVEEAFYNALQLARPGSVLACGTVYTTGRIIDLHRNLVSQKTEPEKRDGDNQ